MVLTVRPKRVHRTDRRADRKRPQQGTAASQPVQDGTLAFPIYRAPPTLDVLLVGRSRLAAEEGAGLRS